MDVQIRVGDCRRILADMTSGSMDCCVTSPPYYRLRDYDHPDQIGAETTPGEYVAELVDVFRGVRRILKNEGTLWLNLGDSYGRDKQLLGIPWRVAFALQDDGWILRSEIIWDKTSHKPERVKDRPTTAHERIFLFSKNPRYFYDAEAVAVPSASVKGRPQRARAEQLARESGLTEAHISAIRSVGITDVGKARATQSGVGKNRADVQALADEAKTVLKGYYREFLIGERVNLRTVWRVAATTYPGVHTAVFPPELIEPCIKAGCPRGGTVLDPFGGAGTTGLVAHSLGRRAALIEINPSFAAAAQKRVGIEHTTIEETEAVA